MLARDPDSVDYDRIMSQLDEADRDIDRISAEGAQTAESDLWTRLQRDLRGLLRARRAACSPPKTPRPFASVDLFRDHEAFISVVARLIEAEYRKVSAAQAQIDRRSARLLDTSVVFAAASVLLALVFAVVTVRMVSQLIRGMEWQTAELGRVSWHMLEDQEATARRFSHELHDELGQSLTAVKTNLAALDAGGQVDRRAPGRLPAPGGRSHRQRAADVAASAAHHPRRFRPGGRPALAVRRLRRAHRHRRGFRLRLSPAACPMKPKRTCSASPRRRSPTWRATPAPSTSRCGWSRADGEIRLTIHDDGRGLPAAAPADATGKRGLWA